MTRHTIEPWWVTHDGSPAETDVNIDGVEPRMTLDRAGERMRAIRERMLGFTWDWRPRAGQDAGLALAHVVAEQQAIVGQRLNRLPGKLQVAFWRMAGIDPRPATPAQAFVEFEVAPGARRAVRVDAGFRLSAPPIDGEGDAISFETVGTFFAQPARIAALMTLDGDTLLPAHAVADAPEDGFAPFPERPTHGAWLIGLEVSAEAVLRPRLTLGIQLATRAEVPPPRRASLNTPSTPEARPLIRWDALDGDRFVKLEVVSDETREFSRSGLLELSLPRRWRPAEYATVKAPLRWLRARVMAGGFADRPVVNRFWINAAEVKAVRTVHDEPLEPLGPGVFRLRYGNIRPASAVIEVDERGLIGQRRWAEVADLGQYGPTDRVYRIDRRSGRVYFGDGVHGAALPADRGLVTALRYEVGAEAATGVVENTITTLSDSAPFLVGVTNPLPAAGGQEGETQASARRRGPAWFRARGRAVSLADCALLARDAPGARIARAHAVDGLDPSRPGRPIPGVVGLFVVPPDRSIGPPTATEDDLRAVSRHLAEQVGPAGIEVIAAAPRYHTVSIEASVRVDWALPTGRVVEGVLNGLNRFLHPLTGGIDGRGWPFGGAVRFLDVQALIEQTEGVIGVTRMSIVVDGIRVARCTDYVIPMHDLLWPTSHEIIPEVAR